MGRSESGLQGADILHYSRYFRSALHECVLGLRAEARQSSSGEREGEDRREGGREGERERRREGVRVRERERGHSVTPLMQRSM